MRLKSLKIGQNGTFFKGAEPMFLADLYRFRNWVTFEYDSFFRKCNRLHLSTIPFSEMESTPDYISEKGIGTQM